MAKKQPIIHPFSEEFNRKLSEKSEQTNYENDLIGYSFIIRKRVCAKFHIWHKKPPILRMKVTMSALSLEELEDSLIKFLS